MIRVSTRLATPADGDAIAPLFDAYRQFYEQPADLPLAQRYIEARLGRNESVILVAEREQLLLGFCQLYPTFCSVAAAPIFTLYDLFVSPDARQLGVGRALLMAAEQHAAACGYVRLDLTTARTNTKAQALYVSLGWEREDVFLAFSKTLKA